MKRNIQIEKCIGKYCRKMVKVDHSLDIPGFAYASGSPPVCIIYLTVSGNSQLKIMKQYSYFLIG